MSKVTVIEKGMEAIVAKAIREQGLLERAVVCNIPVIGEGDFTFDMARDFRMRGNGIRQALRRLFFGEITGVELINNRLYAQDPFGFGVRHVRGVTVKSLDPSILKVTSEEYVEHLIPGLVSYLSPGLKARPRNFRVMFTNICTERLDLEQAMGRIDEVSHSRPLSPAEVLSILSKPESDDLILDVGNYYLYIKDSEGNPAFLVVYRREHPVAKWALKIVPPKEFDAGRGLKYVGRIIWAIEG